MTLLKIHQTDNVAVALAEIPAGSIEAVAGKVIKLKDAIASGHKVAIADISAGSPVIKYGFPIGVATEAIHEGDWVHTHNVKTGLGELLDYQYQPNLRELPPLAAKTFQGYRRPDGKAAVRNELWIIPTVGCVNRNAELIARQAGAELAGNSLDGIYAIQHPYGCSQLGDDHKNTQRILADLVKHPNAGGVLVLGLGCENNYIETFKQVLGDYDPDRVKFLEAQSVEDEISAGVELVKELSTYASRFQREAIPVSELVIGLKCGGSDGFSGISANPLVGALSDRVIAMGGSTILTEVPEMFGAETILMNRTVGPEVFDQTVKLINDFKNYFKSYNQPVYENPSPGNKKGGITTLEEKSLGCTQKGGTGNVVDVLHYGDTIRQKGLTLLSGPGNDGVACTTLAAAGCHIILFTTGRGTPLGTVVPTVKVASNSRIFQHKANWLDFNAGRLLEGTTMPELAEEFLDFVLDVASGKPTKSEVLGFKEVAIFKNGVTL